ncbi:MAG TPA: AAA domain-containing protein, partial [Steroidobacteraceae bacterium]|nr:AAA domain-containing protein [Steroidobacteraceae bacterium]
MPPTSISQATQLLEAFVGALRDEIAAAKSAKGDSVTSLTDGRRTQQGSDHAIYTFLMERPVAASDDVPVELEVGGRRYKGSVLYANGEELVLIVHSRQDLGSEITHAGLVSNLAFLPQRLRDRLELVHDGREAVDMSLAMQVFAPQSASAMRFEPSELPALAPGPAMNASQHQAACAAQTHPVSFVWGPPGTGKTVTLARIAEAFLRRGMRVLVVAHSNVAVDEAAADIAALLHDTPWYQNREILRLGHYRNEALEQYDRILFDRYAETIAHRLGSDREAAAEAQRLIIDRARVLCTTLTQTFVSGLFPETPFDVCLVDEASMAPLPYLWWALTRAHSHASLCGDFLQLPPVALARTAAARRWLGRNIYQHLGITTPGHARNDPRVFLLNTQYRMHPRIAGIPNLLFYDGLLSSDPSTADRLDAAAKPLLLVDTSHAGAWCVRLARGSRLNLHSAHVATTLAHRFAGTPPAAGRVAIITPYAAQARLLGAFISDLGLARAVRVATVHRFQ